MKRKVDVTGASSKEKGELIGDVSVISLLFLCFFPSCFFLTLTSHRLHLNIGTLNIDF